MNQDWRVMRMGVIARSISQDVHGWAILTHYRFVFLTFQGCRFTRYRRHLDREGSPSICLLELVRLGKRTSRSLALSSFTSMRYVQLTSRRRSLEGLNAYASLPPLPPAYYLLALSLRVAIWTHECAESCRATAFRSFTGSTAFIHCYQAPP